MALSADLLLARTSARGVLLCLCVRCLLAQPTCSCLGAVSQSLRQDTFPQLSPALRPLLSWQPLTPLQPRSVPTQRDRT